MRWLDLGTARPLAAALTILTLGACAGGNSTGPSPDPDPGPVPGLEPIIDVGALPADTFVNIGGPMCRRRCGRLVNGAELFD